MKKVGSEPKPASPAPADGGDPRNDLLAAIRGGAKLKHVDAPDPHAKPAGAKTAGGDLAATLASALAKRHKAQDSSDDSDDSDWDDD